MFVAACTIASPSAAGVGTSAAGVGSWLQLCAYSTKQLLMLMSRPPVILLQCLPAASVAVPQGCQVYIEGQLQPRQWGFSIVEAASHQTILRLASDNKDEAEKWVRGLEKVGLPVRMGAPPAGQRGSRRKQRRHDLGEEGEEKDLLPAAWTVQRVVGVCLHVLLHALCSACAKLLLERDATADYHTRTCYTRCTKHAHSCCILW
jgi:hypothetical protein